MGSKGGDWKDVVVKIVHSVRRRLKHDAFGLFERARKMHGRAEETDGAM